MLLEIYKAMQNNHLISPYVIKIKSGNFPGITNNDYKSSTNEACSNIVVYFDIQEDEYLAQFITIWHN